MFRHICDPMILLCIGIHVCMSVFGDRQGVAYPVDEYSHRYGTVVTAYYPMHSKHTQKEYLRWMTNTLSLQDPMVIYTTQEMHGTIRKLRSHALPTTKIIVRELKDTPIVTKYGAGFWESQHAQDPERSIHPEVSLYWVWHAKPWFLSRVVDSNPFASKIFAWLDIGYLRTREFNGKRLLSSPKLIPEGKVTMLDVSSLVPNYVGGGFIGGDAQSIATWHIQYYKVLDAHTHEFIGKDQPWMWITCTVNQGLCNLITPQGEGDRWFYMVPYLIQQTPPVELPSKLLERYEKGGGTGTWMYKSLAQVRTRCLAKLLSNMPKNAQGQMKAHHWDARTPKWNEQMRWDPLDLHAPCLIWYIGANTHGRDGVRLQREYPCHIHVFEPVPAYAAELKQHWKAVPRSTVHAYGLGSSNREVTGVRLAGESTFGMRGASPNGATLEIRKVTDVWRTLGCPTIDLLHANCEGCEWELWESILESGMIGSIKTVQVGTHWFPQIHDIERRYCAIEADMLQTHSIAFKQAFAWERWVHI